MPNKNELGAGKSLKRTEVRNAVKMSLNKRGDDEKETNEFSELLTGIRMQNQRFSNLVEAATKCALKFTSDYDKATLNDDKETQKASGAGIVGRFKDSLDIYEENNNSLQAVVEALEKLVG